MSAKQRWKNRSTAQRHYLPAQRLVCTQCGLPGSHFLAPSMGQEGFYVCDPISDAEANRGHPGGSVDSTRSLWQAVQYGRSLAGANKIAEGSLNLDRCDADPAGLAQQGAVQQVNQAAQVSTVVGTELGEQPSGQMPQAG